MYSPVASHGAAVRSVLVGFCVLSASTLAEKPKSSVFTAEIVAVQSKVAEEIPDEIDFVTAGSLGIDYMAVLVEEVLAGPEIEGYLLLIVDMDDDDAPGLVHLDEGVTAFDPDYWQVGARILVKSAYRENWGWFTDYMQSMPCPRYGEKPLGNGIPYFCEHLSLRRPLWPYCYCVGMELSVSDIELLCSSKSRSAMMTTTELPE